ncbi:MAG: hypothetical protein HY744_19340 [Deltaproteobacteria bacterium]|nr:hypothetical protein [Deltaproteobacteria bacterium]
MEARAVLPGPQPAWRRAALLAAVLALSCSAGGAGAPEPAPRGPTDDGGAALPGLPPVTSRIDPRALPELLHAVPSAWAPPTDPDGGTRIGTDTGEKAGAADAGAPAPEPPRREPKLVVGQPKFQPQLSSAAIERAAREQLYWPIVQKCRGPDGQILPPEVISLSFVIRPDGAVDPSSVKASARHPRYEKAVDCVLREFAAVPFVAPRAALGSETRVVALVPSVD